MSYITGMQLSRNDATPQYKLGAIGQDSNGYLYKYVQYNSGAGAIAAVIGNACGYYAPAGSSTGTSTVVTSDVSDTAGVCAGALMSVMATGEYGWVQCTGRTISTTALVSGADGNLMRLSTTTDGTYKVAAAVTDCPAGALLDDTTKAILLDCPH